MRAASDPFVHDPSRPVPGSIPPPTAPRRRRGALVDRTLAGLVHHALAFAAVSLVTLLVAAYAALVSIGTGIECEASGSGCGDASSRFNALFFAAAGVSVLAAAAALVGAGRGLARGWPGGGRSHVGRFVAAMLLALPTTLVALAPFVAWFVDWYRH